jgi:DNA-binding transcriptional LysR family regulator
MSGLLRNCCVHKYNRRRGRSIPAATRTYDPAVTLNQLKVFVLVVRLGSFRAAASALGVSESAVSQALAALRQDLGDPLVERNGSTLKLTAAGQRVVGLASQMVNLAVAAEDAVRAANGHAELLRVVASANVGDAVAPALLQAFARRAANVEATLGIATSSEMQALLSERLADVALGPALAGPAAPGVVSEPLLRYRLLVVAPHDHHARRAGVRSLDVLRHEEWMVDPTATDRDSELGRLLAAVGVAESNVLVFPTQPAAWAAAAKCGGVAPAIEHLWVRDRHPGLAPLPVPGTPIELMWHVNMLHGDGRPAVARRLHRFLSTSDATQAMYRADGGVPASRFRPPVYVTLWS